MAAATTQRTRKTIDKGTTTRAAAGKTAGKTPAKADVAVRAAVPLERWPDKKLLRIGEVATLLGVEAHVVRFWLQQFRSVRPERSDSNRLLFGRPAAERLLRIRTLLYEQGYTIAGAKKALSDSGVVVAVSPPAAVATEAAQDTGATRAEAELTRQVARLEGELRAMAARLQAVQASETALRSQAEAVRARSAAEWAELADDLGDLAAEVRG